MRNEIIHVTAPALVVKTMRRLLLLAGLFFFLAPVTRAQDYSQSAETTLSWTPSDGEDGVDASVQFRITYDTFFGEPTVKVVARATKGNTIYYNGQQLTRAEIGDEAWKSIDFGPLNFQVDIYQGNRRLSTVPFNNVISVDVSGSPDWNDVFPGLNEEQAKNVFREGFHIRNIRLTGLSVTGMYGVERYLREKQTDTEYAAAVQEADRLFDQQRLDEASQAYARAYRIKREDYPHDRIEAIKSMQEESRREAAEAERAAQEQQARQEESTTSNDSGAGRPNAQQSAPEAPQQASNARPSSAQASGLTHNEQQRFDGAIADARQYERVGNYTLAISQYRYAYGLSPEPWIRQRISQLSNAQAAEQERQRAETEENARQLAEGMRAVGGLIDQHEASANYNDPRIFQLYGGFLFGYSEASSNSISSGTGMGVAGATEINLWLGDDGQYNLGGRAGADLSLGIQLEDELNYRAFWSTYDYAVKLGWGGHVELGHGARTYSQTFADNAALLGDSGVTVNANEGITFLSVGNFKRKGDSWRLTFLTTTGMALLGGGTGLVSEQVLMFERWPRNSMGSWRFGLQGFQTGVGGLDWDDATYFIGYGIDIR